ncbi:haloalkane dehalogenase [Glycomyces salinus]|uniref:haloalkane dehalogenase n=1 Tax=Glycomyces salinus TaxID=980294 RepID=UPI0018EDC039|nr:haloalkane dehalogenase [Glycomyces salinus]
MHTIEVLESEMSYKEEGGGPETVVLLHGNPTSSHIWRKVTPRLSGSARVVAPDLIGMGDSGKPDIAYSFAEHAEYLEAFLDAVGIDRPVLVGYDWGGSLAMDWAARHPGRARGLVVMETFLRPMTWAEYPAGAVEFFKTLRTPGAGERMALEENWFIEQALRATNPGITEADLDVYRSPYPTPGSRRPLLAWPRQIPLDGTPAEVAERFEVYVKWLVSTPEIPKTLLTASPHGLGSPEMIAWARENIAGLEIASLGEEVGHHAPEDAPEAIAEAVAKLIGRIG